MPCDHPTRVLRWDDDEHWVQATEATPTVPAVPAHMGGAGGEITVEYNGYILRLLHLSLPHYRNEEPHWNENDEAILGWDPTTSYLTQPEVPCGGIIALSGNEGSSTGPHVHIEICRDGSLIDPIQFLQPAPIVCFTVYGCGWEYMVAADFTDRVNQTISSVV